MTLSRYVQEYIDIVEAGEYPVCEDVRALIEIVKREFSSGYIFLDEKQAEEYMRYEKYFPFNLFPWERFCFVLHNCTYYVKGHRLGGQLRWPILMIYVGRGAGKNGYLGFEDFCLLTKTNGIPKYNIDIFAMAEKQAKMSWQDVYDVLEANEKKMKKHFKWTKEWITCTDTNSTFAYNTSSPKTKDGFRPGKTDFDEVHAYMDTKLLDVATTGLGKIERPRRTYISTDGDENRGGVLDTFKEKAEKVLHEGADDNGWLYFMNHIESQEEIDDKVAWHKANPSMRYLPHLQYEMELEYMDYLADPIGNRSFASKRLNFPAKAAEGSITDWDNIKAATEKPIDMDELIGRPCVAGFDYMSTTDMLGAGLLYRIDDRDIWVHHTWVCSQSKDLPRIKAPLRAWEELGVLTFVDGPEIPADIPVQWVVNMAASLNSQIKKIGIDKYRYQLMCKALAEVRQPDGSGMGFVWSKRKDETDIMMTRPSDEMQISPVVTSKFVNHLFEWGQDPCMAWMAWNTKMEVSAAGNITYGKKEAKSRKTDTFKALIAAECVAEYLEETDFTLTEEDYTSDYNDGVFIFD